MASMKTGLFLMCVASVALGGCDRPEIHSYRVTRSKDASPEMGVFGAPPASTPPATVPPPDRNPAAPTVVWTTPASWKAVKSDQPMRVATLDAAGVEVTVAAFPGSVGGLLANVNRWRGQIGLPPATENDLPSLLKTTQEGGTEVSIVDMTGSDGDEMLAAIIIPGDGQTWFTKSKAKPAAIQTIRADFESFSKSFRIDSAAPSASAPMAAPGGMPGAMPGTADMPNPHAGTGGDINTRLEAWKPPANWTKEQVTVQFLTASFQANNAEGGAKATVASLMGDAGGLLANINRWRGQLELNPVNDLTQQPTTSVGAGSMVVDLSNAAGTDRMIVGVVATPQATWFFKLRGTPKGVEQEKAAFEAMVKTVGLGGNS